MSIQEAINHLHTYSSTNGSGQTTQDQHKEAKRMAIAALEKQIPEPAEIKPAFVRDDGIVAYKRVCPDCGHELKEEDICPNCGKWIRWDE